MSNVENTVKKVVDFINLIKIMKVPLEIDPMCETDNLFTIHFNIYNKLDQKKITFNIKPIEESIKNYFTYIERKLFKKLIPIYAIEASVIFILTVPKYMSSEMEQEFYEEFIYLSEKRSISDNTNDMEIRRKYFLYNLYNNIIKDAKMYIDTFMYPYVNYNSFIDKKFRSYIIKTFLEIIYDNIRISIGDLKIVK